MTIYTLDLNFQNVPQIIASYLLTTSAGPILIETGPGSTLKTLITRLAEHGFEPGDIKHLFVTHIHLDHAGAAGWWAQQGTQVYVHHFGADHLIDPSKLLKSASRIYGDQMETLWGEMLPAPAEKVTAVYDGDVFTVGDLQLKALETPGHARHHHVWQLGDIAFTGDASGIRLPPSTLVDIPTPPPEFDKEAWLKTIDLLQACNFSTIYPTHFGPLADADHQFNELRKLIYDVTDLVHAHMKAGVSRDEIVSLYRDWVHTRARALGMTDTHLHQYETTSPLYMSVDGIMRYWQKKGER